MKWWVLIVFAAWVRAVDLDTIPDNTWIKLNISYSYPSGYTGAFYLRFWCDFTWDADSQRILFWEGYGGDHNQMGGSIYANAIYEFKPAAQTVRLLKLSTYWDNPAYNVFNPGSGPVTPHPRHSWGAFRYIPEYKAVYLGSGACGGGADSWICSDLWKYHSPSDTFIKINAAIPDSQLIRPGYGVCYNHFPGSDTLWVFAPDGGTWVQAYVFNLAAETWSRAIDYGTKTYGLSFTAEDPARGQILVWTSEGFYFMERATAKMTRIANQPDTLPASASAGVMAFLPKYGCYFIYSPSSAQAWIMNPADTSWHRVADNNDPGKRIDRYFVYDPLNDVLATFNVDNEYHVFRYKPDGGTGADFRKPPPAGDAMRISPNPFGAASRISVSGLKGPFTVSLYDLSGKRCAFFPFASNHAVLDGRKLAQGVYIVRLAAEGSIFEKRVILIR